MVWLWILLGIGFILLLWSFFEAQLLQLVHSRIETSSTNTARGDILAKTFAAKTVFPLPEQGLRIILLSDFHGYFCLVPAKKLRSIIVANQPDVLLIGGDIASGDYDRNYGFQKIKKIIENLDIPVYAVRGNHDSDTAKEYYDAISLPLLENKAVQLLDRQGMKWTLAGLADERTGVPNFAQAISNLPASGDLLRAERCIAFSHSPDTVFRLNAKDCAVLLSGHYHGGQIRLPFRLEFRILRRKDSLHRQKIYQWHYEQNGVHGYITKGVGCVLFPLRFLCPPELSVIDLYEA